jgi:hypothetical protein
MLLISPAKAADFPAVPRVHRPWAKLANRALAAGESVAAARPVRHV